jgi:signal peptidase II
VIPGYWEWEYTRNPGAAFGILSDADSPWRIPFFIGVSLLAVVVIMLMLRGVDRKEQLTIWALSLIAGGAIGNFVDRVLYGWVIDFVVWKASDQYRWPTFNVADAFISVGVGLLILEMIVDSTRKSDDADEGSSDEGD